MKIKCNYKFINSNVKLKIIRIELYDGQISTMNDPNGSFMLLWEETYKDDDYRKLMGIHDTIIMDLNKCELTDEPTISNDVLRSKELKRFLRNNKIKKLL